MAAASTQDGVPIVLGKRSASRHGVSVIHRYTQPLYDAEGRAFLAEAHGEPGEAGLWEGWIEFVGLGRAVVLRTGVETRQSDRRALAYWASGIGPGYLEGALARATRARLEAFRT